MTLKQPLRVLQLIPALHEGGTEQGAVDMAFYTRTHGGVPFMASAGGRWAEHVKAQGIHHTTLSLNSKMPWSVVWNIWRIWYLIRKNNIHIVHARSRLPAWCGWVACKLTVFRCVRFITTFHGTYGHGSSLKKGYNRVMLKGPYVIANSNFIARHITTEYGYPPDHIVVAERGVDTAVFNPTLYSSRQQNGLRAELKVPPQTPLFVMVGRLTRWKGHTVLLEALSHLKDIPWVLALAGDSKNQAYLDELKALTVTYGIADRVRFLGPRQDVALLNVTADIALSCSVEPEAFGRVAIEAMAMGTPIVASAHGGSLDTVVDGTTGWLVPPGDADALAHTICRALKTPKTLENMGKKARTHVLARFTSAHTCAAEWSAYEKVMGSPATGGYAKRKPKT
ncbi:MAG: glycosyltransferase family 4 protein [Alphaproteobacteria bacterium]